MSLCSPTALSIFKAHVHISLPAATQESRCGAGKWHGSKLCKYLLYVRTETQDLPPTAMPLLNETKCGEGNCRHKKICKKITYFILIRINVLINSFN